MLTCLQFSQKSLLIFAFILPVNKYSTNLTSKRLLQIQFKFRKCFQYTISRDLGVDSHGIEASMQSTESVPYYEDCSISLNWRKYHMYTVIFFFFCTTVKEKGIDDISEEISVIVGDSSDTEKRLEKVLFARIFFSFKHNTLRYL